MVLAPRSGETEIFEKSSISKCRETRNYADGPPEIEDSGFCAEPVRPVSLVKLVLSPLGDAQQCPKGSCNIQGYTYASSLESIEPRRSRAPIVRSISSIINFLWEALALCNSSYTLNPRICYIFLPLLFFRFHQVGQNVTVFVFLSLGAKANFVRGIVFEKVIFLERRRVSRTIRH